VGINKQNKRFIIDQFRAESLESNPLNSQVDRDLRIYLPPDYYDSEGTRFPVLYYLHGYGGNNHNWTITSKDESERVLPLDRIPKRLLDKIDVNKLVTYEMIDNLIERREIKPFILVQPDASLHLPNINNTKNLQGKPATKGSFYINSISSGNYKDYIAQDVLNYTDSHYRTIADKQHRALLGGSMGGAGVLRIALTYSEKFIAGAALSPGNLVRELLNWNLVVPLNKLLFGDKISKKMGKKTWADILDTCDLIFSKDKPLLPSIKRDENGEIISLNQDSLDNWIKHDINNLIKENPNALKKINLLLNCARKDEMGSAIATQGIHETLNKFDIPHQYELYNNDPKLSLSPHVLGIAYHIVPAIEFCLQYIT
jgi:S-formylglutathione hydrolase FrmB